MDAVVVEQVSRNGGVDRVDERFIVIPLAVFSDMRVPISDFFRDYPAWRVA